MSRWNGAVISVLLCGASISFAQESSLSARKREADAVSPPAVKNRVAVQDRGNKVAERYSWIAIKPKDPPTYKVHDLITIIVREQRTFEADSDLESKKDYEVKSELDAMFKLTNGGLGATGFQRGKPTVDYGFETKTKNEADTKREDRLVTRITGKIVDIKPNGILVLEAKGRVVHDDEVSVVTLTGQVRKEDVTPDNTVLSTQLAEKDITISNEGELRNATRRGWIPKLIDFLRPF
jgi:flagellar L-ring protein precursor FlgH